MPIMRSYHCTESRVDGVRTGWKGKNPTAHPDFVRNTSLAQIKLLESIKAICIILFVVIKSFSRLLLQRFDFGLLFSFFFESVLFCSRLSFLESSRWLDVFSYFSIILIFICPALFATWRVFLDMIGRGVHFYLFSHKTILTNRWRFNIFCSYHFIPVNTSLVAHLLKCMDGT